MNVLAVDRQVLCLKPTPVCPTVTEHSPPDVGLGHDVFQSIAELKEGLHLEYTGKQTGGVKSLQTEMYFSTFSKNTTSRLLTLMKRLSR